MNPPTHTTTKNPLHEEARQAADSGDLVRAAALLEEALSLAPDRADIARDLGRVLAMLGQREEAVAAFARSIDGYPRATARDHYDHGACLTQLGRHESARTAYERALAREPGWLLALDNLGVTLQCLGEPEEAERVFRQALDEDERPRASGSRRGRCFTLRNLASLLAQTGRLDEALATYHEALALVSDDPDTHHELAKTLHGAGLDQEAENAYRAALKYAPGDPLIWRNLGDLMLARQRSEDAEAAFHESLALTGDAIDAEALRGLGASLHLQERFDEALLVFNHALDIAPDNPSYLYHRAVLFEHMGHNEEAAADYRATLATQPEHLPASSSLASLLYRTRDFESAHAAYLRVLELAPDDVTARYLATVLERGHMTIAPAEYISRVFDGYARDYDEHMVGTLGYRVPVEMRALLAELVPDGDAPEHRYSLLDLGCGTGLVAAALKDLIGTAHGVDLAAEMVERARQRDIYEELFQDDILSFLQNSDAGLPRYDLIVAADVFVYIGDVSAIFAATFERLSLDGRFLLSIEVGAGSGFSVQQTGRFTHSRDYIEEEASCHGMTVEHVRTMTLRTESNVPVEGCVFALTRTDT